MRILDKFEYIAAHASYACCILGNLQTSDFELLDFGQLPLAKHTEQELFSERGMRFIGIMGLVDGVSRVALSEPLDDPTAKALSLAFVQRVEDIINAKLAPKDDSLDWLNRLYQLPDTRREN